MKSKKDSNSSDKKYTFFESPLGNIENTSTSENTIKEAPVVYKKHFRFTGCVQHRYPTVDNGGLKNGILSFEHMMPGDTLRIREEPQRTYSRNQAEEMKTVNFYMNG